MIEILLTYPTPEGSQSIAIEVERTSFGRGSEATHRFDDEGLSRLNSTIYRDGDKIWIVDENSTNGTFVNGERPAAAGTPLRNGDTIKIGHNTNLTVRIVEAASRPVVPDQIGAPAQPATALADTPFSWIPVAVIAGAFFVICVSVVFIGVTVFGSGQTEIVQTGNDQDPNDDNQIDSQPTPRKTTEVDKPSNSTVDSSNTPDLPVNLNPKPDFPLPSGKKYLEMSDTERRQYLEARAMRVAQVIGNSASGEIPAAAIDKIKSFVDAYASRSKVKPLGGCRFGDNLQATFERASKNAPFIVKAFNEKGIDPRIGLYLAMIESEHCVCLQSGTGPLGMFQFTYATAKLHFDPSEGVIKGASPGSPDVRCQPEPAARAAASYMKALTGRYGTGPASVPLAIGSYNSGEGGLSSNLQKALDSGQGLPRDFWTLIAKGDLLSKQFQSENFKYVPKFFAAAIIGENPQDFGLACSRSQRIQNEVLANFLMTELWLKIKDHEGQDQRIKVDRDAFTIGRHSSNDLCIPNSKLSREHVKIERIGADFLVSDSGSTNGTKINGQDLKDETKLQVGDRLDLGGGVLAEVVPGDADAMEAGESDGDSTEHNDLSNGGDSINEVPSGGLDSASGPALASPGGIPTSIFYIAPILGVMILVLLGGLIFFVASGDPSKPSSNDFVYTGNGDSGSDRPSKTGGDDPPSTVTRPGKTPEDAPPSNSPPTDNTDPVPTPAPKDPTTDSGKCEQAGAAFLRRIAQNDPKAFLTGEQAQIVSGKVKQIGSSSALADNINSARRSSAQIKALSVSKNLKPQFLATAALAKLGTTRGDALQAAQEMADTLDKLGTQIGSELANDSLLMIAAYDQGVGGDFMKMRNMLQDLATKSPDSARAIRTIWFLHKNGKITDGEYDFALRFLAIGTIMQNPKDFGVNAEALTF